MSWWTKMTGQDRARNRRSREQAERWGAGNSPERMFSDAVMFEQGGGGWEDAFERTAGAYVNDMLPSLRHDLQLTREDAIRRGISTGDLGTSNEGDVVTSWGRGISDALGRMSMQGYENNRNRYLDLLTGQLDRDAMSEEERRRRQSSQWGAAGSLAGAGIGFAMGGPAGAAAGARIGSGAGSFF